MEHSYNMRVRGYMNRYVKKEHQKRFTELMIEWDMDECNSGERVMDSFYSKEVLEMKHAESKEGGEIGSS